MKAKIKIAIVGLGYVGLPLAIEFGKYFQTIGFDLAKTKISSYKKKLDPNKEVASKEFYKSKNLTFTNSSKTLSKANIIIITVPTPIDKSRKPDLSYLQNSSLLVGKVMKKKCIVVYESTVYPGVTEEVCVPLLEKSSKFKWKKDFFVGYSPERINPGDKKKTLTNIIKVVSGDTPSTLQIISKIYKKIIKVGVYEAESIKVAEAAKVIENTQRDINIALMNELSLIFEKMGINTSQVLEAASTKWNFQRFKPGLVGGHCIGVDPYYLVYKASELGIHTEVIQSGRKINDRMPLHVASKVVNELAKNNLKFSESKIIILGLTFKENVSDIRNSKMIEVYNYLRSYNINIFAYDPYINKEDIYRSHKIKLYKWNELPNDSDAIIYGVSHKELKKYKILKYKKLLNTSGILYDIQSNLSVVDAKKNNVKISQL